jgi:hypothetical protein
MLVGPKSGMMTHSGVASASLRRKRWFEWDKPELRHYLLELAQRVSR